MSNMKFGELVSAKSNVFDFNLLSLILKLFLFLLCAQLMSQVSAESISSESQVDDAQNQTASYLLTVTENLLSGGKDSSNKIYPITKTPKAAFAGNVHADYVYRQGNIRVNSYGKKGFRKKNTEENIEPETQLRVAEAGKPRRLLQQFYRRIIVYDCLCDGMFVVDV